MPRHSDGTSTSKATPRDKRAEKCRCHRLYVLSVAPHTAGSGRQANPVSRRCRQSSTRIDRNQSTQSCRRRHTLPPAQPTIELEAAGCGRPACHDRRANKHKAPTMFGQNPTREQVRWWRGVLRMHPTIQPGWHYGELASLPHYVQPGQDGPGLRRSPLEPSARDRASRPQRPAPSCNAAAHPPR